VLVFSSLIYKRQNVQTTVLRASGTTYQVREDGSISNLYNAELINKTNKDINFVFKSDNPADRIEFIQKPVYLPKEGTVRLTFFLIKKPNDIAGFKTDVVFKITTKNEIISTAETTFFAQP
ncbi:MAG: cytochrome c oxidase accessory protein CcoG, partial [Pedobacter sp.]